MTTINSQNIDYKTVVDVAKGEKVNIGPKARKLIVKTRDALEKEVKLGSVIYGVTTGFGMFKNKSISGDEVRQLQRNLILSHSVGVGKPFEKKVVRAMMFLMANYLSKGHSGVRLLVVRTLVEMLNKGVHPIIPEKGSVGSSGDLAPSAHLILVMIGEGEAEFRGQIMTGRVAMHKAKIKIVELEAKEGLALINNTSAMTANAVLAIEDVTNLVNIADICGSLSSEALRATLNAFSELIHDIKPHPGQIEVAKRMRYLLTGSKTLDTTKVQDQYSIRCIPQIHGAVRGALNYATEVVNIEANSVTDNPLIFFDKDDNTVVLSGGNFHGESVAMAMDTLGMAICEIANISDRRIASLLDPANSNGLPAFLVEKGGLNSGMMILQYATAALVSENKILAHPAVVDSIPTSANVEDLVSMGTISARKAREIIENVKNVLAIELMVAAQAIDFRLKSGFTLGQKTNQIFKMIRTVVPFFATDSIYYPYTKKLVELINSNNFAIILNYD